MQILDSLIDGALEFPSEREGNELIGKMIRYLKTGQVPVAKGVQKAYLVGVMPVLKNSREKHLAGIKGGNKTASKSTSKTASKNTSKPISKSTSEEEEEEERNNSYSLEEDIFNKKGHEETRSACLTTSCSLCGSEVRQIANSKMYDCPICGGIKESAVIFEEAS